MIKIHVKEDSQEFQAGEGSLAIVFTWMVFTKSLDFLQTAVGYLVCYDKDQPKKKKNNWPVLLVGMWIGKMTLENCLAVFTQIERMRILSPTNLLLGMYPTEVLFIIAKN